MKIKNVIKLSALPILILLFMFYWFKINGFDGVIFLLLITLTIISLPVIFYRLKE